MSDEDWIKTLADDRKVRFTKQEVMNDCVFITAQIAGNEVVYSIILSKVKVPLSREEVEIHFQYELSKK